MGIVALVEGVLRTHMVWRVLSIVLFLAMVATLPWRRRHPLAITVGFFGIVGGLTIASLITDSAWEGLNSSIVVLLVPYALFRWASGRHAVLGLLPMLVTATLSMFQPGITGGDVIGGYLVLLFPAVLGAEIRALSTARAQQLEQARSTEREQLARELHDTVAHHVSAIAVQAQAGQAVGVSDPAAALHALSIIEEEASRTLAEMRGIVGALRADGDDHVELAPQPGIADLDRLARNTSGVAVEVEFHGDIGDVRPSVDTAVYRIVQESITNANRHARNASRICVRVDGEPDAVRLRIHDDGDPVGHRPSAPSGYGLVGMTARATLLGGTLTAGPDTGRGWTVHAVIPRTVRP